MIQKCIKPAINEIQTLYIRKENIEREMQRLNLLKLFE